MFFSTLGSLWVLVMLAVSGLRTINPACELGLGQTRGHDEMTSHDTDDMSIPSHEFPHDHFRELCLNTQWWYLLLISRLPKLSLVLRGAFSTCLAYLNHDAWILQAGLVNRITSFNVAKNLLMTRSVMNTWHAWHRVNWAVRRFSHRDSSLYVPIVLFIRCMFLLMNVLHTLSGVS